MKARNRIKELRFVKASELVAHELNWRSHPDEQKSALTAMLEEVGWTDAIVARETDDGQLQVLDGHLRRDLGEDEQVPVLVLDVTEEEGRKILLSHDPIAAMAEADRDALAALIESTSFETDEMGALIERLRTEHFVLETGVGDSEAEAALPPAPPQPADAAVQAPITGVRVVQLLLDEDTHKEFAAIEARLRGILGTTNTSDTVMLVMREANKDVQQPV